MARLMTASPRNSSRSLCPAASPGCSWSQEVWVSAWARRRRSRMGRPSCSARRSARSTIPAGSCSGRRVVRELGVSLVDVFDGVADGPDALRILVGDLGPELLFEAHDQLDQVERVRVQVVDEGRLGLDLFLVDAELLDDDLLEAVVGAGHWLSPPGLGVWSASVSRAIRPRTPFMRRRIGSPLYVRASSTHSAMATRAGVSEYSTSPIAQRSSERSIRASWTTGYWGAVISIRASMSTRCSTTAATIRRASSPAPGSASTSARARSSTAVGVRCPKSASNTDASATRRPARRDRTRSVEAPEPASEEGAAVVLRGMRRRLGPDAVDEDRDLADVEPEQPLDGAADGIADVAPGVGQVRAGAGDDPELDLDAVRPDADHDRRASEGGAPGRAAAGDPEHVRHLQRREAGDLDDDPAADGQVRRHRHVVRSGVGHEGVWLEVVAL